MKPGSIVRIARPTDNLAKVASMYCSGLGFEKLSAFEDHAGFNGVIIGHPGQSYHLEFTSQNGHLVGNAPTKDHLLAFYIPEPEEWESTCQKMRAAGFSEVASFNPYWDVDGRTFEDVDGYRVVLQQSLWR